MEKRTLKKKNCLLNCNIEPFLKDVTPSLPQAPAAFGLVSFLMHAGLERNRIRKHLLVFALAAPVLAMLTFLGLSQVLPE